VKRNIKVGQEDVNLKNYPNDKVKLMTLRCGDINGDGEIDQADLNILWQLSNYNKRISAGADSRCDLNGDVEVNQIELNILWLPSNYNLGAVEIDLQ
jgi:hypothetical protein